MNDWIGSKNESKGTWFWAQKFSASKHTRFTFWEGNACRETSPNCFPEAKEHTNILNIWKMFERQNNFLSHLYNVPFCKFSSRGEPYVITIQFFHSFYFLKKREIFELNLFSETRKKSKTLAILLIQPFFVAWSQNVLNKWQVIRFVCYGGIRPFICTVGRPEPSVTATSAVSEELRSMQFGVHLLGTVQWRWNIVTSSIYPW